MLTILKFYFVLKGNGLVIINDFLISHRQPAFCLDSQRDAVMKQEPNSKQQVTEGVVINYVLFFSLTYITTCELLQLVCFSVFYHTL